MAMFEAAMVSTAIDGAGGCGGGPWRKLIRLKKTALNGCTGFVVEWDASADRYLCQVVAPSAAACEALCGPWALFKVKAANIQACFHPGRSATAKALATLAAPQGHGATASTRDGHGNTSTSAFAGQGRVDGQGQAASSQLPPPAPAALEYITDLAMVAPEINAEMEATLVSNM